MIATLQFDLDKTEDATFHDRCLNAENYALALYDIKKRLSELSDRNTKAELFAILSQIYAVTIDVGV